VTRGWQSVQPSSASLRRPAGRCRRITSDTWLPVFVSAVFPRLYRGLFSAPFNLTITAAAAACLSREITIPRCCFTRHFRRRCRIRAWSCGRSS